MTQEFKTMTIKEFVQNIAPIMDCTLTVDGVKIQRNPVWDDGKRSDLISTAIEHGLIMEMIFIILSDSRVSPAEGRQRSETYVRYCSDEFPLSPNTPDYNGVKLAGKKYSELPAEIRERLDSKVISINFCKDATRAEIIKIFIRCNSGVTLTKMEILRPRIEAATPLLSHLLAHPFASMINISESAHNRGMTAEAMLYCAMMEYDNKTNLGFSKMKKFVDMVESNPDIADELEPRILKRLDYMYEAFSKWEPELVKRMLKKGNIAVLYRFQEYAKEHKYPALKLGTKLGKVVCSPEFSNSKFSWLAMTGTASSACIATRHNSLVNFIEGKKDAA